ncbi:MAG: glycosyltransferase [Kiritimatiellae bacterium]|nr:glycosyltransferase [Kiritimatiellia bacterium]
MALKSLVIWVHSACRSTVALYRTATHLAEADGWKVTVCEWGLKKLPAERLEPIDCQNGSDRFCHIGDDLEKGRAVLREQGGPGSVQVFCVYQNSPVWRQLIVEAKRGGARVVVNAEAPCEMCLGFRAVLKRLYYYWILPFKLKKAVKSGDLFISSSGEMGIDRLIRLGWKREKIVPFGYSSPRLVVGKEKKSSSIVNLNLRPQPSLRALHLGGEAAYRGVKIAEEAARIAGVELVKTGGKMPEEELVEEICRADVVVGCGYCEPWGMRINDALLEGTPVIVSDGMGVAAVCDWYGCGCVVPKGDAQALARVLKRCKDEPEFLERLRSGAKVAAKELLPENRAKAWLNAVLGSRG